ncbi:hypothetical protein BKA57DRAFT_499657 [Linnemannia elongata]|nr:hypothetical protein BKA57DRAFT_499657 [Linnemannia elongata]
MKSSKIFHLPWTVLLVVLLATVGTISIDLTSAAPVLTALSQAFTERTPESIEPIPPSQSESMEGSVELTKHRMKKSEQIQAAHPDSYMERDLSSTTPEKEEFENYVDLSKRRMMADNPYGMMIEIEEE